MIFEYGVILLKNPNVSVSTAETYKKYSNRFCDQYLTDREMIENIRKNLRDNGLNNLNFNNLLEAIIAKKQINGMIINF